MSKSSQALKLYLDFKTVHECVFIVQCGTEKQRHTAMYSIQHLMERKKHRTKESPLHQRPTRGEWRIYWNTTVIKEKMFLCTQRLIWMLWSIYRWYGNHNQISILLTSHTSRVIAYQHRRLLCHRDWSYLESIEGKAADIAKVAVNITTTWSISMMDSMPSLSVTPLKSKPTGFDTTLHHLHQSVFSVLTMTLHRDSRNFIFKTNNGSKSVFYTIMVTYNLWFTSVPIRFKINYLCFWKEAASKPLKWYLG